MKKIDLQQKQLLEFKSFSRICFSLRSFLFFCATSVVGNLLLGCLIQVDKKLHSSFHGSILFRERFSAQRKAPHLRPLLPVQTQETGVR